MQSRSINSDVYAQLSLLLHCYCKLHITFLLLRCKRSLVHMLLACEGLEETRRAEDQLLRLHHVVLSWALFRGATEVG